MGKSVAQKDMSEKLQLMLGSFLKYAIKTTQRIDCRFRNPPIGRGIWICHIIYLNTLQSAILKPKKEYQDFIVIVIGNINRF